MKKAIVASLVLIFGAMHMSALSYVDVGLKAGVGLDFLHYADFGNKINAFYREESFKKQWVTPSFMLNTDLWFTERIALSVNFSAMFNRGGSLSLSPLRRTLVLWEDTTINGTDLWRHRNTTDGFITYKYHSYALDLMAKTNIKLWYIKGGLGLALHQPVKLDSDAAIVSLDGLSESVIFPLPYYLPSTFLGKKDVKPFIGLNLVLETGLDIPIHQNGFLTLGTQLRYDVLARKKAPVPFRNVMDIVEGEVMVKDSAELFRTFDNNQIRFGSPLTLSFLVGYTYRFGLS